MTERKTKGTIEAELDMVGMALLKAAYGIIMCPPDESPVVQRLDAAPVKPDVFNAVVGWIRVKNKLEPDDDEESGLDKMAKRMGKK